MTIRQRSQQKQRNRGSFPHTVSYEELDVEPDYLPSDQRWFDTALAPITKRKLKRYMKKNDLKVQKIVEYCEKYCEENKVRRIDKVPVAAWWSNIYNANILWTKLRCINFIDDGTINELSDIDIWDLANVEHNRWNMEQLLMTYSPLTKEEMFDVLHYHDKPLRNIYKGVMKHSDLCSCNQLKVYGKTFKYDVAFARDLVDNYYKVKENNKCI